MDNPQMIETISDQLMNARKTATPLREFPVSLPQDAETAYAIQHRSIRHWPGTLAGFKVGGIAPQFRDQFGANWLAGAVFSDEIFQIGDGETKDADVFAGGFAAFEPEWIFVLDNLDWSKLEAVNVDGARDMVSRVHMGMEIASSPMPMINDLGPGAIISDFGNNTSVWIGPEADLSMLTALDSVEVRTVIDGTLVGEKSAASGSDGPLGALTFLINHLLDLRDELELPTTLYVSSGAVTGVHDSVIGALGVIEFDGIGRFGLNLIEKSPTV